MPSRGARPRFTVAQIVAALTECKGLVSLAARKLGCADGTVLRYIAEHEECRTAREDARRGFLDVAEAKLYERVLAGEPWAVQFVLKTLGKDRGYVERQERTGADGQPIKIVISQEDVGV